MSHRELSREMQVQQKLDLTDTIKDGARLFLVDGGIRRQLLLALTEDSRLHIDELVDVYRLLEDQIDIQSVAVEVARGKFYINTLNLFNILNWLIYLYIFLVWHLLCWTYSNSKLSQLNQLAICIQNTLKGPYYPKKRPFFCVRWLISS